MDQVLLIGSLHFPMLRFWFCSGSFESLKTRFLSKPQIFTGGINKIDIAVILLTVFIAVNGNSAVSGIRSCHQSVGESVQVFGVYFLLRFLIRDEEDVVARDSNSRLHRSHRCRHHDIRGLNRTQSIRSAGRSASLNYASLAARGDRFRAQGPFGHSILAGTFGAVLLPLFVALWWKGKKYRKIAALGIISATVMTLACNSSTPVLAYAAGVLALCLWPGGAGCARCAGESLSYWSRFISVMKGPVWSLIEKIDISGGSSSYHRYMLIDQCIRHFGDWWLIGREGYQCLGLGHVGHGEPVRRYLRQFRTASFHPVSCDPGVRVQVSRKGQTQGTRLTSRLRFSMWAFGAACLPMWLRSSASPIGIKRMVAWYALLAMISVLTANSARPNSSRSRACAFGTIGFASTELLVDHRLASRRDSPDRELPQVWHEIQ